MACLTKGLAGAGRGMRDGNTSPTGSAVPLEHRAASRPIRWLLLTGSRLQITLLLLAVILLALLTVGTLWELEMEILVTETRAVQTMFNTLLGGIILFVSVVLSINTAALSQEFGPLQTKRTQIEEDIEFRSGLEEFVDTGIIPADIRSFFGFVLRGLRAETEPLRDAGRATDSDSAAQETTTFVNDIESNIATIERRLEAQTRRLSTTLLAALDWDSVEHITLARHLLVEHGDDLRERDREALANLIEILTTLASGREYFTTLYFKQELRRLSSSLVVLSLPVIVFTAYVLLAIDAGLFPTATAFGIQPRLLYVSIAFVIALSPYVLLSAYMLRIVTVSRHTLASGGFTVSSFRGL